MPSSSDGDGGNTGQNLRSAKLNLLNQTQNVKKGSYQKFKTSINHSI